MEHSVRRHIPQANKCGFTLIELSIVLVIIGLLVGGVLVGNDLIRAAELRNIEKTTEQIKTAVYTFKNKYNGYPGDLNNATSFFTGASNGNNNSKLDTLSESRQIWLQLSQAGLISGNFDGSTGNFSAGVNIPGNKKIAYTYRCASSSYIAFTVYNQAICYIGVGNYEGLDDTWAGMQIMTPDETKIFDQKYDDGVPSLGKIMATRSSNQGINWCTDNNAYANTTSASYISGSTIQQCILVFPFPFN